MALLALAPVPTLAESDLLGFNFLVWHGPCTPRGTTPEVIAKINAAPRAALKDPDLIKRQESVGISVITDGRLAPAEHKNFFDSEINRWTSRRTLPAKYGEAPCGGAAQPVRVDLGSPAPCHVEPRKS